MSVLRSSALAVLIVGLGACAERAPEPTPAPAPADSPPAAEVAPEPLEVVRFACGGTDVEARFYREGALLIVDGEEIALSEVVAASGMRYASGSDPAEIEFWSKGTEAMLTMHGTRYPTCQADAGKESASTRYRATGQEPGWSLTWWGDGVAMVFAAENQRIEGESIERLEAEGGWTLVAQTARGELRMSVESGRTCRDSMSGMPHPDSVRLQLGEQTLNGCGGEPMQMLRGAEWRLVSLDGNAVLDEPEATLNFLSDDEVAGRATCNRYSGRFALSGEGLSVGPIAATKMACMGDGLMEQEALFLDILGKAVRFDIGDDGHLRIEAADGRSLTARR